VDMRYAVACCFIAVVSLPIKNSVQREDLRSAQAGWGGSVYSIRVGTGEIGKEPAVYLNCTRSSFFGLRTEERWVTADMLTLLLRTSSTSRSKGIQGLYSRHGSQTLAVESLLLNHDRYLEEQTEWIFATDDDEDYFKSLLQDVNKCVSWGYGCKFGSQGLLQEEDDEFACVTQQALTGVEQDL